MRSRTKPRPDERISDWKDGFLFLGNHLALDFLNTRPVEHGESLELLPDFEALLRWFQVAGLLNSSEASRLHERWGHSAQAEQTVKGLRKLREKLRKDVHSWESGAAVRSSTVDELNRLMAEHPMRTRLNASGGQPITELYFEPHQPEDLFSPLAHSAARLFADVDHNRVRKCEKCIGHFYDTSKKGARRWCSMQLCGNRQKVAAYAARQRLQAVAH